MLDDGTVVPSQIQTVYLRDGLDLTMNVAPSSAANAANPLPPTMVVYGARSASVINLGDGNDIVFVGGTRETFKGGDGSNTFYVNGTTIGATINGGNSGTSALFVRGGGAATMGANITNMAAVTSTNATGRGAQPDYGFRANTLAGLRIRASSGNDTPSRSATRPSGWSRPAVTRRCVRSPPWAGWRSTAGPARAPWKSPPVAQ